jgi:hypothetical protein
VSTQPRGRFDARQRAVDVVVQARRAWWAAQRGDRSLDELGLRHGADKSSAAHDFARVYERYVAGWRQREVTLLEIGVWRGASLRMWRDYFPRARVFGVDVNPLAASQAGERIEIFIGGQSDEDFLSSVVAKTGPLDLIVDDGSHLVEHQMPTLSFLWPHLRPGGIYVVEDTHTSYLESYGMGCRAPDSTIARLTGYVDDLHKGWHSTPATFEDLDFVHFYPGTCVLQKEEPTRTRPIVQRLNAAAARRSGAWTG